MLKSQARVQGGGAQWNCPPPLEIESKKKASEQIVSLFTYILLLFLVANLILSAIFLSWAPPLNIEKSEKPFKFSPPPLRIPGHATESGPF